jgi:hypothetical protein
MDEWERRVGGMCTPLPLTLVDGSTLERLCLMAQAKATISMYS